MLRQMRELISDARLGRKVRDTAEHVLRDRYAAATFAVPLKDELGSDLEVLVRRRRHG